MIHDIENWRELTWALGAKETERGHWETEDECLATDLAGYCCALIGICSCGSPVEYLREVERILGQIERNKAGDPNEWVFPSRADELVMQFLDSRGILEHGSSIVGAWISDDGRRVLELIRRCLKEEA